MDTFAGNTDEEEDEEIVNIPFIPASDSGSRLQNEFEVLKFIGKGGFGDVIKVSVHGCKFDDVIEDGVWIW